MVAGSAAAPSLPAPLRRGAELLVCSESLGREGGRRRRRSVGKKGGRRLWWLVGLASCSSRPGEVQEEERILQRGWERLGNALGLRRAVAGS